MSHVYASVVAAVGDNTSHLERMNKQFCQLLKEARDELPPSNISTFAQAEAAKMVHFCDKPHYTNKTLKKELHLILRVFKYKRLKKQTAS